MNQSHKQFEFLTMQHKRKHGGYDGNVTAAVNKTHNPATDSLVTKKTETKKSTIQYKRNYWRYDGNVAPATNETQNPALQKKDQVLPLKKISHVLKRAE